MNSDISPVLDDPIARARHMLQSGQWAAREYATFDRARVWPIVDAVAAVAFANSAKFAELAVRETGFGVVEDKRKKNEFASQGIVDRYRDVDLVSPRIDSENRIVEFPRPAGVVLALTPSTNPVSTLYFKVLLALMTRNAIVVSPHPLAVDCCTKATHMMAEAAVDAGAPRDVIQVVDKPSVPLIGALMVDIDTNVILATGGSAVVRAAYSSGNPAIGVGPGNAPVLVDATADIGRAASDIVASKSFDNSLLCSAESVLICEQSIAERLVKELVRQGAYLCSNSERDRLRSLLFPTGNLNTAVVGKDAQWLAKEAGIRVSPRVRVLLAPIDLIVSDEVLAHEKLCPVLAINVQLDIASAIRAACATLRITGAGHSAAIYSGSVENVMAFASAVNVLRVVVNAPNSTGVSGMDTNLAPTMTVGTGFMGRSSLGENLEPKHLVNWARIAYGKDPAVSFPDFSGLTPWQERRQPVTDSVSSFQTNSGVDGDDLREKIRRLLIEELGSLVGSGR